MKKILFISTSVVFLLQSYAQVCPNAGFETGTFNNWIGGVRQHPSGNCPGDVWTGALPYAPDNTRHVLINDVVPVFDPITCNTLERTPPGKTTSARVGNVGAGGRVDEMSYTVSVTPQNSFLLYEYSCVVEEPNPPGSGAPPHDQAVRPKFTIEVRDNAGNLIGPEACNQIEEWANPDDIGLRNCNFISPFNGLASFLYYRPWTKIGVDLRSFEGLPAPQNEVTITFTSFDCGLCGHFGYGYIFAKCDSLGIEVEYCENENIATLTAPEGFSYNWQNGQTTQQIVLNNPFPGQDVWVDLITIGGCTSRLDTKLRATKAQADFNSATVCLGTSSEFINTSSASYSATGESIPITSVFWDFGDGNTSNSFDASHVYVLPNTYNVTLTIQSEKGCESTISKLVTVLDKPVASFAAQDLCLGDSVLFVNNTMLSIGTFGSVWDFGELGSSTNLSILKNPKHKYDAAGLFPVTLIVEADNGCKDTLVKNIEVHSLPSPAFVHSPPCKNDTTYFTDASVSASSIVYWEWDFGDGSPNSSVQNPKHVFRSSGPFNVKMRIGDINGCFNDTVIKVLVKEVLVDFTFNGSQCVDKEIQFNSLSSVLLTDYFWDFDDLSTSNLSNPLKPFAVSGIYNVKFMGVSIDGCKDSIIKPVEVFDLPLVDFITNNNLGCDSLCVDFINNSFSNTSITNYLWDFGDGSTSNDTNPVHCYYKPGDYDVKLIVETDKNCEDSVLKPNLISIAVPPVANFDMFPRVLELDNPTVNLTNRSSGETNILWEIDTLITSINNQLTYTFIEGEPRTYDVCLSAFSNFLCKSTTCKEIIVKGYSLFVPNAFTPDGDGENDTFYPRIIGIVDKGYNFYIFNRWGELIFNSDKRGEAWDGKHKGRDVKQDVYVWKVVGQTADNEKVEEIGHLTVLKKIKTN